MKLFAVAILAGVSTAHADNRASPGRGDSRIEVTTITPRQLVNGRAACGNTGGKGGATTKCVELLTLDERSLVEASLAHRAANAIVIEKANATHVAKHREATYTKLMVAMEAAIRADASLATRLLINGRPACGNTMAKGQSSPAYCGERNER
ncbi:MAG TPA: hypothetical protein VIV11_16470 [Kofleriaceae bacterium]